MASPLDGAAHGASTTDARRPHQLGRPHELDLQPLEIDEALLDAQELPRADGGKDAWLALGGCFVLEALVWGFPFSYGVFQDYYTTHPPFSSDPGGIAAIATTATGIMFLASPLVALIVQRWPRARKPGSYTGIALMTASLIAASFCNSTGALLATQGILYALGGLTCYFPAMYLIDEWFLARKGLAFAVIWSGTGVAGAVIPFFSSWLLRSYGFRTTLRVWALIIFLLATPSVLVMKNRLPTTGNHALRPLNLSFLRHPPFWLYSLGNFAQSIAYFLPLLWLPSFAREAGFPPVAGPLALCLLNVAATFGYLSQGLLVDRFHATTAILVATTGGALSVFLFWGFTTTTTQPMLYVFVIFWGLTGGGFAGNWPGCAMSLAKPGEGARVDTGLVISLLCASKGMGSVVSGPLGERLVGVDPMGGGFAYGGSYGVLIVFTGVSAVFGGVAWMGRVLKAV